MGYLIFYFSIILLEVDRYNYILVIWTKRKEIYIYIYVLKLDLKFNNSTHNNIKNIIYSRKTLNRIARKTNLECSLCVNALNSFFFFNLRIN